MIYITQLLCPQRHCIVAMAWDEHETSASEVEHELRKMFRDAVQGGHLDPYCGLCRSETFHCENARTLFSTMAEALPHLREQEREQLLTAAASHTG